MTIALRVLVTGVGGDLGQAIVKALALSDAVECHGCDADAGGVAPAFVERFHAVPTAQDPGYMKVLARLCRTHRYQAIIPASVQELDVFARLDRPLIGATPVVCQDSNWYRTYGDKLTCMSALEGKVPLAPFAHGADREAVGDLVSSTGYPVIVKSRHSSGSKRVRRVETKPDLDRALADNPDTLLVQGFIDGDDQEYTVGVFGCDAFTTALAFRRDLGPVGCSWFAETSGDAEVLAYARAIATVSKLRGSANVQVRRSSAGVRLLEVNARFSSLAAARAAAGFHDVYWSLLLALGRMPSAPAEPYRSLKFHRFFHEMLDVGGGYAALEAWNPRTSTL
jgi:carbamoyl-phosphate synthase large subunit